MSPDEKWRAPDLLDLAAETSLAWDKPEGRQV